MKQRILSGWNFQRLLFLIIGTAVIAQSIVQKEWLGLVFGGYFAVMGLFGLGCAAGNCYERNCYRSTRQNNKTDIVDVNFEEVKK